MTDHSYRSTGEVANLLGEPIRPAPQPPHPRKPSSALSKNQRRRRMLAEHPELREGNPHRSNWWLRKLDANPIHGRMEKACEAHCKAIGRTWSRLPMRDRDRIAGAILRTYSAGDQARWQISFSVPDILNMYNTPNRSRFKLSKKDR